MPQYSLELPLHLLVSKSKLYYLPSSEHIWANNINCFSFFLRSSLNSVSILLLNATYCTFLPCVSRHYTGIHLSIIRHNRRVQQHHKASLSFPLCVPAACASLLICEFLAFVTGYCSCTNPHLCIIRSSNTLFRGLPYKCIADSNQEKNLHIPM